MQKETAMSKLYKIYLFHSFIWFKSNIWNVCIHHQGKQVQNQIRIPKEDGGLGKQQHVRILQFSHIKNTPRNSGTWIFIIITIIRM